jgi:RNA polymerase sigma factor (sigma-70 family)
MASRMSNGILRAALSVAGAKQLTDRELLTQFNQGDQIAFASIVKRHTGMVFSVCRRVLPTVQDAEDACQAVFLVLARKAKTGRWQSSIANWLYITARRIASTANRDAARRLNRQPGSAPAAPISALDEMTGREAFAALDEELDKLPAIYREPLVLFYLQELTRDEAATRLGIPSATLKSQLDRGRKKLADALTKRGIDVGAGLLAAAATSSARASSLRLVESILATCGSPSASIAVIAQGVSMSRFSLKSKVLLAVVVLIGGVTSVGVYYSMREEPAVPATGSLAKKSDAEQIQQIDARAQAPDRAPYLELVEVSHRKGQSKAMIWDRMSKEDYQILIDSKGTVVVTHYYYTYERNAGGLATEEFRKSYPRTQTLNIGEGGAANLRRFVVRRILENELVLEPYDANRAKAIKGPDALVLGAAAAALIMPDRVQVWRVGQFLTNPDPKRASTEVTSPNAIRELLMRPLAFVNEGNGTIASAPEESTLPNRR